MDEVNKTIAVFRRVRQPSGQTYRRMVDCKKVPERLFSDEEYYRKVVAIFAKEYPGEKLEMILCGVNGKRGFINWGKYLEELKSKED